MTETAQEIFNRLFAENFTPDEARYVWVCHECGYAEWRERDSKYVKAARSGELLCGECESPLELVVDAKDE